MKFPSRGTPDFWHAYQGLPVEVKELARKNYYRAVGKFYQNVFVWEWIGTHEEYNKRF